MLMPGRRSLGFVVLAGALSMAVSLAQARDDARYPDLTAEDNHQVRIGGERYYVSGDGYLMPTRRDQPAPDLRAFDRSRQ